MDHVGGVIESAFEHLGTTRMYLESKKPRQMLGCSEWLTVMHGPSRRTCRQGG